MALYKEITLDSGIVLNYHRVARVESTTNLQTVIEVQSYISQEQREKEKLDPSFSNVFVEGKYFILDYDKNMNVDKAYAYLKTTDMFSDATDILEEGQTLSIE